MANPKELQLENKIKKTRESLLTIGDMRSGSLTKQYRDPKNKKGGYWSLSYTSKMRSHTQHIFPEHVQETRRQILQYKKFKKLMILWIDLARKLCELKIKNRKLAFQKSAPLQNKLSL
jgi:hypothetical protein